MVLTHVLFNIDMEFSSIHLRGTCSICMLFLAFLCVSYGEGNVTHVNDNNATICQGNSTHCALEPETKGTDKSDTLGTWDKLHNQIKDNRDMLQRAFYILLGITGIVVVYFVFRAIRIRRRRSRTRRYGLLSGRGDKLEMAPLDNGDDEDEEDVTVFEMNGKQLR